jgi:hypothetical protein
MVTEGLQLRKYPYIRIKCRVGGWRDVTIATADSELESRRGGGPQLTRPAGDLGKARTSSALNPELRLARAVVGPIDVPVPAERVLIHRGHEVERRLELDVVESRIGRDQLVPVA